MRGRIRALALPVLLSAGCTGNAVDGAPAGGSGRAATRSASELETYVYECADGDRFVARTEGEVVWLFLPNQTLNLPRVRSRSGRQYAARSDTLWAQGEQAVLQVGNGARRHCRNNRAMAIWEDAKLRGVDFRAVGNEPGWNLEIVEGGEMVFVGSYGQTKYKFTTPEASLDPDAAKTIYRAEGKDHEVVVVLEGRRCQDTMSGELFETTVTVHLDDQEYRGCGRSLH